jgi:MFS family permease
MNSEFGELAQARYRSRTTRRRVSIVLGLLLIALGYLLMAVSPDSSTQWALFRVMAGLGCIIIGFAMAVLPLIALWTQAD